MFYKFVSIPIVAVHPTAAADAAESKPGEIFADNTLMTMLNCCLNPGNNDVQCLYFF